METETTTSNIPPANNLTQSGAAAVDVERNELILMKVYTTRNYLTTKSFIKEVLNYCENRPKFVYR